MKLLPLDEQHENLKKVLNYLLERNNTRASIAKELNYDNSKITKILNDDDKSVTDQMIDNLKDKFDINPNYIRYGSPNISNEIGRKLDIINELVDEWETIKCGEKYALCITMDENYYNFLTEYGKARVVAEEELIDIKDALRKVETKHKLDNKSQEYVVLPRNMVLDIIKDTKNAMRDLAEIIDPSEYV